MAKKHTEINPDTVIDDYFAYVEQYRLVSSLLGPETLFPTYQVRELLIELSLKTYLCALGKNVQGHNLNDLTS